MILGDNTTALVDKDPAFDSQRLDLVLENSRIDENTAADAEFGLFIDKTGWDHADTIFMVANLNRVPGVRAYTTTGDDDRFIRMCDVGNNLALSLISKKSTYDNSTAHWSIM